MFNSQIYEDEIVLDLIDQMTENPQKKNISFSIPDEDMKSFVVNVKNQKVTFDLQAEIMMKKYYNATNAIRKRE